MRLVRALALAVVVVFASVGLVESAGPSAAQVRDSSEWELNAVCTPAESYPEFRRYEVFNPLDVTKRVVLLNESIDQAITVDAPAGFSYWLVPADATGQNTAKLIVDGVHVDTSNSGNQVCLSLAGTAMCDPNAGTTTITWTAHAGKSASATIVAVDPPTVVFNPLTVPPGGTSHATQVVTGPADVRSATVTITADIDGGAQSVSSETVTLSPCQAPIAGEISVTFTKTPDRTTAAVGDTIVYTYAGTNTGAVALEVELLVDDRLGILIQRPQTIVLQPGETLSEPVSYVVQPEDADTLLINSATVTVRRFPNVPAEEHQGVATATVAIAPLPPEPPEPPQPPVSFGTSRFQPLSPSRTWTPVPAPRSGTRAPNRRRARRCPCR
jgi:uncharacterized repeat protein (TIGR01451 family)